MISIFQQELRGLYQYHALAVNVGELNSVKSTMAYSMLKTLAGRYRSRVSTMRQRFGDWVEIEG